MGQLTYGTVTHDIPDRVLWHAYLVLQEDVIAHGKSIFFEITREEGNFALLIGPGTPLQIQVDLVPDSINITWISQTREVIAALGVLRMVDEPEDNGARLLPNEE